MTDVVSFPNWLKQRRGALDLTQAELADEVGCATITVQKIESGERRPSKQMAKRFAICLHVTEDARPAFVRFARGEPVAHLATIASFSADGLYVGTKHFSMLPPLPPTTLYGRDHDLAALRQQLLSTDARLLTLIGPPGVGKSRLGAQTASEMINAFEHGVFYVPLATVADPDRVLPAIARVLGLVDSGERPLFDRLGELLWDKNLLLVLDNFEQVVSSATLLARLLSVCPLLKILVTSRVVTRVRGEHLFPVRPLALPALGPPADSEVSLASPAVALFVDRAQAVRPDFALTAENAADVAALCHRLDGLPLAIELTAAWSHLLPPRALLANLDQLILSRSGGLLGGDRQQQTMVGAIDWSYHLLPPEEQRLFRQLSVFVGGWTLEAVENIRLPQGDCQEAFEGSQAPSKMPATYVLDGLASLVNKSLVVQYELDGEARFTFLEAIRLYALNKRQAPAETDSIRWRHARYFIQLAEEAVVKMRGPEQLNWFNLCEVEHDNLRAALKWLISLGKTDRQAAIYALRLAAALMGFWSRQGYLHEGRSYLEQARVLTGNYRRSEQPDLQYAALLAGIHYHVGTIAWLQGDRKEAQEFLVQSDALWRALGRKGEQGRAYAQTIRLMVEKELGHLEQAYNLGTESVETLREMGDEWGLAMALNCFGSAAVDAHDTRRARLLLEESAATFRALGDEWGLALSLMHLSRLALSQGEVEEALRIGELALSCVRKINDGQQIAYALNILGDAAVAAGDQDRARVYYQESLTLWQKHGHKSFEAHVKSKLADLSRGE